MQATHCETVRFIIPWRITSWAKAIGLREVAKPDKATCDPGGIEETALERSVTFDMLCS
jgi:hypothetical protein